MIYVFLMLIHLTNENFIELINNLIFPSIEYTVGPKSLSKGELIAILEENWGNII